VHLSIDLSVSRTLKFSSPVASARFYRFRPRLKGRNRVLRQALSTRRASPFGSGSHQAGVYCIKRPPGVKNTTKKIAVRILRTQCIADAVALPPGLHQNQLSAFAVNRHGLRAPFPSERATSGMSRRARPGRGVGGNSGNDKPKKETIALTAADHVPFISRAQ